jgi:hypothetical protein
MNRQGALERVERACILAADLDVFGNAEMGRGLTGERPLVDQVLAGGLMAMWLAVARRRREGNKLPTLQAQLAGRQCSHGTRVQAGAER